MDVLELADNQAESGVISTLVYHPEFILHTDYLKPGYFYNQDNGCIYWAISELYKKGIDNIDAFNISSMLSSNKAVQRTIEKYNLPSIQEYIDLCSETARHTLEEYKLLAQTVVTLSYKRDMIKSISEIQKFCQDKTISQRQIFVAVIPTVFFWLDVVAVYFICCQKWHSRNSTFSVLCRE